MINRFSPPLPVEAASPGAEPTPFAGAVVYASAVDGHGAVDGGNPGCVVFARDLDAQRLSALEGIGDAAQSSTNFRGPLLLRRRLPMRFAAGALSRRGP